MWWSQYPTIKEANRYLDKLADELLAKHGSQNEAFEAEILAITGISNRQRKNYKNHPQPRKERLKQNSLVIKYIRDCQKRDKRRQFPPVY